MTINRVGHQEEMEHCGKGKTSVAVEDQLILLVLLEPTQRQSLKYFPTVTSITEEQGCREFFPEKKRQEDDIS